jgi:hypothetical protein
MVIAGFRREMARFHKAWNIQGKVSPLRLSNDNSIPSWTVDTFASNRHVTTDYH